MNNDYVTTTQEETESPLFRSMNLMAVTPASFSLARETSFPSEKKQTGVSMMQSQPTFLALATTNNTWASIDSLRKVSFYHPLEPSHILLDASALPQILQSLTKAFQALSCQVEYATENLMATASTMEGVEFQISLWAARDENANKVICEMQRMDGDSYTYHAKYAQPIMRAVKRPHTGMVHEQAQTTNSRTTCGKVMDQINQMTVCAATHVNTTEDDIQQAVEVAQQMILSDRYDACLLGMESLLLLTNPASTGWQTATKVAKILSGTPSAASKFLWTQLLHAETEGLLMHALKIWVQVWQILVAARGNPASSIVVPTRDVLPLLMKMVEQAVNSPHLATLALQGLTALCQLQPDIVPSSIAWGPVEYAQAVGHARHAALAQASGQLLAVHC